MDEIGYRPNSLAQHEHPPHKINRRDLRPRLDPFFAGVVRGITDEAKRSGYDIPLVNTDEDVDTEREAVELLMDKAGRSDGAPAARFRSAPRCCREPTR